LANQVGGIVGRALIDVVIVAFLIAVKETFWENDLGPLIWFVLLIGLVLLPWVNWLRELLKT